MLNEVMLSDERFKGYRPVLKHIDGDEVINSYKVEIREAYSSEQPAKQAETFCTSEVKDIIAFWSDWCMDYADEDIWLDYMVKHPDGHCSRQHLQEKWDCCYGKYGSKAAMSMFWRELDNRNRTILAEYITTRWRKD